MPARPPRQPRFLFHWLRRTGASLAGLGRRPRPRPGDRLARAAGSLPAIAAGPPSPDDGAVEREELFSRLVVHDPAKHIVRHLFVVHDEWRREGWPAVAALPSGVLGRALFEAEILAAEEPSPPFAAVVERLRRGRDAAEAREAREAIDAFEAEGDGGPPPVAEVADSDFAEFELMERSWAGTVPAAL